MISTLSNFNNRSVHEEPTKEWTIEELLQWCLLQNIKRTNDKRDDLIQRVETLYQNCKDELLSLHDEAILANQSYGSEESNTDNKRSCGDITGGTRNENSNPNILDSEDKITTTKNTSPAIQVKILSGPHENTEFTLKPTTRHPCFVGRSRSDKFRKRGISLSNDNEVSTTHGKFELKVGQRLYYTDVGSTNGTMCNNEPMEENVPIELEDGMEFLIGCSLMKITLN